MKINDSLWNIWTPHRLSLFAEGDEGGEGGSDGGGDAGEASGDQAAGAADAAGDPGGAADAGDNAAAAASENPPAGGQGGEPQRDLSEVLTTAEWVKHVPTEHLSQASKYQSLGEFMKASNEQRGRLNDALFIPGKDASDEDRGKFFNKLGRPDTAAGYKVPEVDGVEFGEDRSTAFFEAAHGLGLTQAQVEGLMTWEGQGQIATTTQAQQTQDQAHTKMMEEWGEASEANYEKARRAALQIFSETELKAFNMGDAQDHEAAKKWNVTMVQALARNSVMFEESRHVGRNERDAGKSDQDLKDDLTATMDDPNYWNDPKLQRKAEQISEAISGNQSIHPAAQNG